MKRARITLSVASLVLVFVASPGFALDERGYRLPPKEIVDIVDAPAPPQAVVSPAGDVVLLVGVEMYPPISLLAQPIHRLAGVRISAALGARQRTMRYTGIRIQPIEGGPSRTVALPAGSRIGLPSFSHDGKRFAFARDVADGVELWVGDAKTGEARAVPRLRLNDVLGAPFEWEKGDGTLLVRTVPAGRGAAPAAPEAPAGPVVQEAAGKTSQMATFQDLLSSDRDEALFEHYARTQIARVDASSLRVGNVGAPEFWLGVEPSPDGRFLLTTRLKTPFSWRVPYPLFARAVEVRDGSGMSIATVADLPVSDEVPRQGVPTGPRSVGWQPLVSATLVWAEALDGGNPVTKVPHRDRLMALAAPFASPAREVLKLRQRFTGVWWAGKPDVALLRENDRDRRWTSTWLVNLSAPEGAKVVFERSVNDAYKDPGDPVLEERGRGERLMRMDGDAIFLAGAGASAEGDRPFLDRFDLATSKFERLFRSPGDAYERFVSFAGGGTRSAVVRRESPAEPPNLWVVDLSTGGKRKLTDEKDPHPRLSGVIRERLSYRRADGVNLTGTLYLPPGVAPGTPGPVLIWAYPLEYSDADTAGQVRGSTQTFLRLVAPSPLFLVARGYAVLMDATMPVLGDPETVNNTYVEQIKASAKAAVDELVRRGVADPARIVVAGHSYGAFMTANLLAHTNLFAAGIARSGAYNRTLTPFGFQTERRTYWEAPDLYAKVSPFTVADRIKKPLLLIHGMADNNSGTFPIQSERLFEAIRGNGGTARLVMLPHEAHGYRARESVLDTLAEMIDWADRWTKSPPAAAAK
jgi:dipeptidyl aminopeptidase/acylaminoacyl peptidase